MTGQEPTHRDWIKIWIKPYLMGSIREDLTAEERGVWTDFLVLAGNSRVPGVICSNEESPMSLLRMAGMLNVNVKLVKRCLDKFLESGRVTVDDLGLIHIVNWGKYQYSDYDRVKKYRQAKKKHEREVFGEVYTPVGDDLPMAGEDETSVEPEDSAELNRLISESKKKYKKQADDAGYKVV